MKKDRSKFTKEELIKEVEFFQEEYARMELRLKTNYSEGYRRGYDDSLEKFMEKITPLYKACFTSGGWIGTNNIGKSKAGSHLLTLLAHFHGKF